MSQLEDYTADIKLHKEICSDKHSEHDQDHHSDASFK